MGKILLNGKDISRMTQLEFDNEMIKLFGELYVKLNETNKK